MATAHRRVTAMVRHPVLVRTTASIGVVEVVIIGPDASERGMVVSRDGPCRTVCASRTADISALRRRARLTGTKSALRLPASTPGERLHRCLTRRLVAVRRRGHRPCPRRAWRRGDRFEDASDDEALRSDHVVVLFVLRGWPAW